MFARVEVLLPEEQTVLVIPATAVLSAPYGDSVYVIETKPGQDGDAGAGRAPAVRPHRPGARRFRERGIGPEGRRAHRQLRRVQAAQRHGRGGEQRAGAQGHRDAAARRTADPWPRP